MGAWCNRCGEEIWGIGDCPNCKPENNRGKQPEASSGDSLCIIDWLGCLAEEVERRACLAAKTAICAETPTVLSEIALAIRATVEMKRRAHTGKHPNEKIRRGDETALNQNQK